MSTLINHSKQISRSANHKNRGIKEIIETDVRARRNPELPVVQIDTLAAETITEAIAHHHHEALARTIGSETGGV